MKHTSFLIGLLLWSAGTIANTSWLVEQTASCPSFPGIMYQSMSYNVGCQPWRLEWTSDNFGDLTGATIQWYRYKRDSETKANAVPYTGPGSNTVDECYPATDEAETWYNYYCVITKPGCATVTSGEFDVQVGRGDPCMTFVGTSFTLSAGSSQYNVGSTITLTATTNAYGGEHVYTWYHNGEPLDTTDTHYEFVWEFNNPQLIIANCTLADGGTYSVQMQDGTECFMYTKPVRVKVGSVQCGTTPTLAVQTKTLGEGGSTMIAVSNATLDEGETGTLVFMHQPDGSNPTLTPSGNNMWTLTVDMAGTYSVKYVIDNPTNPSCFRESTTENITVWGCGPEPTITASTDVMAINNTVIFTTTGLGDYETGKIKFSKDGTTWSDAYPADRATIYNEGIYTVRYTITNSKAASCNRYAETQVKVYHCGWGPPSWQTWTANKYKVGESVTPNPSPLPSANWTGVYSYTIDDGEPIILSSNSATINFDVPGTYKITWAIQHNWTDECTKSIEKVIVVESCGTQATLSTNKTVLKVGETATLTLASKKATESSTLTYSKDGGAATTLSGTSFTPTSAGTYVITYSISASGCGTTSAKVTIEVYDCGPDAEISTTKSTYASTETVAVTTSTVGANETGTLTYSYKGGAPVVITNPAAWTPPALGTYVLTWEVKHAYIDCTRSATTTIKVADCGDPAEIQADKTIIRVGETVTLTTSTISEEGASGAVTYSKDGGAAVSFTGTQFTPTQVGQYVFTYTISNTLIGCQTQDVVTIDVYDCGAEATLAINPVNIKLGDAATITVSQVGEYETGTLNYTYNGGASTKGTPGSWTAPAAGSYTFIWSVAHSKIDCSRSSEPVTVVVYDCGATASITADKTEMGVEQSVLFTLSPVATGSTGTVTYSKDGGTAVPFTGTQFTPDGAGTYVFTYVVENTLVGCYSQDQTTIKVYKELVFDNKNGTNKWSDVRNWWPYYQRVPNAQDSAILRQPCQVDITDAQTGDLSFDVAAGTPLTILPTGALTVSRLMRGYKAGDIIVRADATGNGALVLAEQNVDIPATVEFYARSKDQDKLHVTWQYMGYPLRDQPSIATVYPSASFYAWTNTPNTDIGGNWQRVDSLSGTMQPFTGYCMTEKVEQVYTMSGVLNDPVLTRVDIPYNDEGTYPGFAFVANSWVAPIDIARMQVSDFGAADATVYIMNTGTYAEAVAQQHAMSTTGQAAARGQYNAIPVHAASYLQGALTTIPPMQGFFVHTSSATTLQLNYPTAVFDAVTHRSSVVPTRVPARRTAEAVAAPKVYRFFVSGFGAEDEVYILESDAFTTRFDNGWDGYKATSELSQLRMAVLGDEAEWAVAAVPQIEGTSFVLSGGNHKTYTMHVECAEDIRELMLWNITKDEYTTLTNGMTYRFKCGADAERFRIVGVEHEEEEKEECVEKFIYQDRLFIRRGTHIFDAFGRQLQ